MKIKVFEGTIVAELEADQNGHYFGESQPTWSMPFLLGVGQISALLLGLKDVAEVVDKAEYFSERDHLKFLG